MKWPVLLLCFFVPVAVGQTVGNCELGRAEADLDVGDVFARVFNGGNLVFGNSSAAALVVPVNTGLSPLYAADFWIGGLVDGELKVAGSTYADFEMWPGPLDENGNPPLDCLEYDRIYSVYRGDVVRYIQTGELTDDLRDWPVELGAPVIDGDGIEGNYNLEGGDQPAIMGDQMIWWVMNDAGNEHQNSLTPPIGIEARVSVSGIGGGPTYLRQATLYRYELVYKGQGTLDSAYVGIWADPDLGNYTDDYVGTDTTRSMSYAYNSDDLDDPDLGGYGIPPALGIQLVEGPIGLANGFDDDGNGQIDEAGERLRKIMSACVWRGVTYPYYDPNDGAQIYARLKGLWGDGSQMYEGGIGADTTGVPTLHCLPGDPVTGAFWSEVNSDGDGTPTDSGGDRHMMMSVGPFRMEPGETQEVVFAMPFGWGTDRFDSIIELRRAADVIKTAYEEGYYNPRPVEAEVVYQPEGAEPIRLSRTYPNPFTDQATIRYFLPTAMQIRLAVFDVLGREVAVLAEGEQTQGDHEVTISGDALRPGVYFVRLEAGDALRTISLLRR